MAYELRMSDWSSDVCSSDLFGCALQVHDVDLVGLDVLLQRDAEFRPLGLEHGNIVFDCHRVQHLAAEALRDHAGADALARRIDRGRRPRGAAADRSEEHTSELQSLMRISYAVFCLNKKKK